MSLITAPAKYAPYPGNADLAYDAVCKVLSERKDQVDWSVFTRDDWQMLVMMAKSEGVGPLLYWYLGKLGNWELGMDTYVPDAVQQILQSTYYQTAAQNAVLFQELERILAAFEEAEIPVIVLKGAALAQTLYPDPGLRPMSDLDLMVKPGNLGLATKTLQSISYTQEKVTYHVYLRGGPEKNMIIEMHWSQVQDRQGHSPDIDWLWTQTENRFIKQLKPAAQFVYLTGHLMLQTDPLGRRLIWFYDLFQLYEQQSVNINWEGLLKGEATTCWDGWILSALYQLQELLGVQLPVALSATPANSPLPQDTRKTTRNFILSAWQQLDRKTRLQVRVQLLFPPKSYLLWRYRVKHQWLWPLYLPRRWWEIVRFLT